MIGLLLKTIQRLLEGSEIENAEVIAFDISSTNIITVFNNPKHSNSKIHIF